MSKIHVLKITEKQLDMFSKLFAQAKGEISVKAETVRDQKAAGKASHKDVTMDIMRAAAYAAVNNHIHGKTVDGVFTYAPNAPEHFRQFGVARVVDHTPTQIVVRAKWLNCHQSNTKVKSGETVEPVVFRHTFAEWQSMWPEVKKLLANPKHKSNLFRTSTAR